MWWLYFLEFPQIVNCKYFHSIHCQLNNSENTTKVAYKAESAQNHENIWIRKYGLIQYVLVSLVRDLKICIAFQKQSCSFSCTRLEDKDTF